MSLPLAYGEERGKTDRSEIQAIYRYQDGRPARWNSCKPITWAYEKEGETLPTLSLLRSSLKTLAGASGLVYREASRGEEPDLLVRWERYPSPAYREAKLRPLPGHMWDGTGLITVQSRYLSDSTYGDPEIVRGEVLLNPAASLSKSQARRALLKNLGHTVGLDYSPDPSSALYPFVEEDFTGLTNEDKAGLRSLGSGSPCHRFPIR